MRSKTRSTLLKLSGDYQALRKSIDQSVGVVDQGKRRRQGSAAAAASSGGSGFGGLQQQQELNLPLPPERGGNGQTQLQQMDNTSVQDDILRERNQEIKKINTQMSTVSEIFRDLANIVEGQQGMVDDIEQQVEESHGHAQSGLEQIEKANEHQKGCLIS
jgi:hypothetical protein